MGKNPLEELKFCLELWERQGFCKFGTYAKCEGCAAPYLLWKMITGEHLDKKRLTLEDWKKRLAGIEKN